MPDRVTQHHASPKGKPSAEDTGTAILNVVAEELSTVARSLQSQVDPEELLEEVVTSAVRLIPGVEEGSISFVIRRRRVISSHATSDLARLVDEVQSEVGEGPCLDAAYEQQTVRVADLTTEQRWPLFSQRASELGAGSMLSFQLFVDGDNLGALNLLSRQTDAFDDESEQVGLLFASHAAVALAESRKLEGLNRAMFTRDIVGQAKGILMERYDIGQDQAFQVLVRVSQNTNTKLAELALELTGTRKLEGLHLDAGSTSESHH